MEVRRMLNILRTVLLVLVPLLLLIILLLPPPLSSDPVKLEFQLAWVCVFFLVGIYWIFNILQMPATAFIPLIALPLLGTVPAKKLASAFMSDHNITTFGSVVLMMAVDNSGLRYRLTLAILKHSSGSIRWIFIYIYLSTLWIAMWINSVAAVYLMMHVIDDILDTLKPEVLNGSLGDERMNLLEQIESKSPQQGSKKDMSALDVEANKEIETNDMPVILENTPSKETDKVEKYKSTVSALDEFHSETDRLLNDFGGELFYAIAVAANIGGFLWPYGNPMGFDAMKVKYTVPKAANSPGYVILYGLTEASWIIYSLPLLIINASVALFYLLWIHFGKRSQLQSLLISKKQRITECTQSRKTLKTVGEIFSNMHAALPIWTHREITIVVLSVIAILLCLTRRPVFITGWADLVRARHDNAKTCDGLRVGIGDSVSLTIATLLLFSLPSWTFEVFRGPPPPALKQKGTTNNLGWKKLQTNYPYLVIIMIGSAVCIGRYSEKPIAVPVSEYFGRTFLGTNEPLLKFIIMMITVAVTIFIPNPGTSIAITQLWFKTMLEYKKRDTLVHGASLLPILSAASLCFIIPSSSVPSAVVYIYRGNRTLSAWYFVRVGTPLLLLTLISTVIYAQLWTPNSLAVLFL